MTGAPARRRSRKWLWIGLGLGLLTCGGSAAIVVLAIVAAAIAPDERPGIDPDEFRQALGRVRARVPEPEDAAEAPCPDAEMARAAGSYVYTHPTGRTSLSIAKVSYESLAEFVEKGPTRLERPPLALLPTREELGFEPTPPAGPDDWLWLEDLGLRQLFHPNLYEGSWPENSAQLTMRDVLGRRYLVVLRASARSMPRIANSGVQTDLFDRRRELKGGDSFTPGVFEGTLTVLDLQSAAVVCRAPLVARSSAVVEYQHRSRFPRMRERPSKAVADDFQARFREEYGRALGRISKLLDPSR